MENEFQKSIEERGTNVCTKVKFEGKGPSLFNTKINIWQVSIKSKFLED